MPIYAYKCSACGFAKDALQKMSDAPLTVCPSCGASTFKKQLTAASFKLKGTGWYVTDFRDEGTGPKNGEAHAGHGNHHDSHHDSHAGAEKDGAAHDAPTSAPDAKPAPAGAAGASSTQVTALAPAPSAATAAPAAKSD